MEPAGNKSIQGIQGRSVSHLEQRHETSEEVLGQLRRRRGHHEGLERPGGVAAADRRLDGALELVLLVGLRIVSEEQLVVSCQI